MTKYQLLLSTLALCTSLHATGKTTVVAAAPSDTSATFSPEQKEEIGRIAAEYLGNNPQFLVTASQKLEVQFREEQVTAMNTAVIASQTVLLNDSTTPVWGPEKADVAVILFFDYQCIFCSKLTPVLEKVIKNSTDTRFLFKEWPIFAARWPESAVAAQTGLRVWQEKGAGAYLAYHNGVFASGHNEGKLTLNDIALAAHPLQPATEATGQTETALAANKALADKLGLTGTPALVVMPIHNPQMKTITVFTGLTDEKSIMEAINVARGQNVAAPKVTADNDA